MSTHRERGAALYDLHGNLPALEAVLRNVRTIGVDRIVVGREVLPGPMPRECVERLLTSDVPTEFIRGNGERETLAVMRGEIPDSAPEQFRELISGLPMPFGEPGAYWLMLTESGIEFMRTSYDLTRAAERIRATEYPHAREFAATHVLNPPSEVRMLEAFSGSQLSPRVDVEPARRQ